MKWIKWCVQTEQSDDGFILDMDIIMVYGYNLISAIKKAQEVIRQDWTGLRF